VVFNLTAIAPTATTDLTAYAGGGATEPHASNLNLVQNATVPNRVIVPVPTGCLSNCTVTIANSVGSVNVAIDVDGWFTDSSGIQTTGALVSGLTPTRVCDTRTSGSLAPGCFEATVKARGHISINLIGVAGIPLISGSNPPVAVVINVTATGASSGTYVTVYPGGGSSSPPGASDLNVPPGVTESNLWLSRWALTAASTCTTISAASTSSSTSSVTTVDAAGGRCLAPARSGMFCDSDHRRRVVEFDEAGERLDTGLRVLR
jgi:hypothetical protein